jgi:hypothetical protein
MMWTQMKARFAATLLLGFAPLVQAAPQSISASTKWVGSWTASQQFLEPQNALAPDDSRDVTLRQIVHLSIGGNRLRVHLSNAFGTAPLHFTAVHIARPISASTDKIDAATDRTITFSGSTNITIPAGADYISDPIDYPAAALSNLAITLHMDTPPPRQTGHPGSRATSYLVHGDLVSAVNLLHAKNVEHWYWISGIDVTAPLNAASIITLGDSITDGHGVPVNGNDRWPDVLAQRLQATPATQTFGVLNQGIGGNRLLLDGLGPNVLARFDRDVIAQTGVRFLIVLEGINDLGMLT